MHQYFEKVRQSRVGSWVNGQIEKSCQSELIGGLADRIIEMRKVSVVRSVRTSLKFLSRETREVIHLVFGSVIVGSLVAPFGTEVLMGFYTSIIAIASVIAALAAHRALGWNRAQAQSPVLAAQIAELDKLAEVVPSVSMVVSHLQEELTERVKGSTKFPVAISEEVAKDVFHHRFTSHLTTLKMEHADKIVENIPGYLGVYASESGFCIAIDLVTKDARTFAELVADVQAALSKTQKDAVGKRSEFQRRIDAALAI